MKYRIIFETDGFFREDKHIKEVEVSEETFWEVHRKYGGEK